MHDPLNHQRDLNYCLLVITRFVLLIPKQKALTTIRHQAGLEVIEGQFAGRNLFYNLNLFNKNPQSAELAYRQLSAICHVTGVFQLQQSEQLYGIPFVVTINNDGNFNNVKVVKDLNGNVPGKGGARTVAAATPAPAPATSAPAGWGPPSATPTATAPPAYAPPAAAAPAAWQPGPPAAPPPNAAPPANGWGPPAATPAAAPPAAPAAQPWQPGNPAGGQPPWVR
jgi:hypothetical protein